MISLFRHLQTQGIYGLYPWFLGIIIPFTLCYLFFHYRMLGAADSKLFSVIGSFFGITNLLRIMFVSLCVGAVISIVKMLYCHNMKQRFLRLFGYIATSIEHRKCEPYCDWEEEDKDGFIPFTIAISLATFWCQYR